MIPNTIDSGSAFFCPSCLGNVGVKRAEFVGREATETPCKPHHHSYHIDFATPQFEILMNRTVRCRSCEIQSALLVHLSGVELIKKPANCEPFLAYLCRIGDSAMLELLLGNVHNAANLVYPSPTGHYDTTLLAIAASYGQLECLKVLINNFAKKEELGESLACAARFGHVECMKLLVSHGAANLNTALESASESGQPECVKYLIDNKADKILDALDLTVYGQTDRHVECLKILLDKKPAIETGQLNDLLKIAANNGLFGGLQMLIDCGANDLNQALYWAVMGNHSKCLPVLIRNGANELTDALNCAALRGHLECVKTLLDHGVKDLNVALALAKDKNQRECEKILTEKTEMRKLSFRCSIQ